MTSRSHRYGKMLSALVTIRALGMLPVRGIVVLCPWPVRRFLLTIFWGYVLHPTSRIGFAWAYPDHLVMGPRAKIGHFTVIRNLEIVVLEEHASLGGLNWITGYPKSGAAYRTETSRKSEFVVRRHAAVTNRHYLDCTNAIHVGEFSTIAGWGSQFLTHSIDLRCNVQRSNPITIGRFCFVGTKSVVLRGSALPDFAVLAANSLLNKALSEKYSLYGGVPAKKIQALSPDYAYFNRTEGFVL
jgi:acetyltransferase-like isoleucine patch superfamily enzyme